jgi:hypothetical protein
MYQPYAQEPQLGLLKGEYTIDIRKILFNLGILVAFALLAPALFVLLPHLINGSPIAPLNEGLYIPAILFFLVFGGGAWLYYYLSYRNLHVYVYTFGLVYHNKYFSQVILWQQVKSVRMGRGFLNISLYNAPIIAIPSFVSNFRELRDKIKQSVVSSQSRPV